MILTIIAIVLAILVIRKLGLFSSPLTLGSLAVGAGIFMALKALVKLLSPILLMLWGLFAFDLIIWAGQHVFNPEAHYVLCTWRLVRSILFNQPF